jgi:hypothetical protein
MAVAPGPVIEDFNVIEDIGPGQIPGFIDAFSDPFFWLRRISVSKLATVVLPNFHSTNK